MPTRRVRHTGGRFGATRLEALPPSERVRLRSQPAPVLAVTSRQAVVPGLGPQSKTLDKAVQQRRKPPPASAPRQTVAGSGTLWAQTIVLATGARGRFPPVGTSASYCRGVGSTTIRNGKRKGPGNVNNGPPYREWASREAAQCARRLRPTVQRFSQRQQAKSPLRIARKAGAHKRARAGYDMMRDLLPFEVHKACG